MKAVDKAYAALREAVFAGKYPPGARITEHDAVALSGVSRTPVREALRRLQSEGLLDRRPHQASVVTSWSREDAEEIFELRTLLECHATRLASARITSAELARMREIALAQRREVRRGRAGLDRIAQLNNEFHRVLYEASGNRRLQAMLVNLIEPTLVIRTFQYYSREALERSVQQHLDLVDMLEARDAEGAEAVMRTHVLAARHEYRQAAPEGAGGE